MSVCAMPMCCKSYYTVWWICWRVFWNVTDDYDAARLGFSHGFAVFGLDQNTQKLGNLCHRIGRLPPWDLYLLGLSLSGRWCLVQVEKEIHRDQTVMLSAWSVAFQKQNPPPRSEKLEGEIRRCSPWMALEWNSGSLEAKYSYEFTLQGMTENLIQNSAFFKACDWKQSHTWHSSKGWTKFFTKWYIRICI